ncbi:MAG: hypothetical protein JJE04_22915 [Acidobacteriia bacterium]|nr:hypothetical protein [Terriglobia bacterium]
MRTKQIARNGLLGATLWMAGHSIVEAQTRIDLRTQGRSPDLSQMGSTKPMQTGTVLPAACSTGELFFKTDAAAGSNLYACVSANNWAVITGSVPGVVGNGGKVLSSDNTNSIWVALGGDVNGTPGGVQVTALQGRGVADTAPNTGNVLRWNSSLSFWEPSPAGTGNYGYSFTGQTQVTIPGATHGLNSAQLVVACYDNATPAAVLTPASLTIHAVSYDVQVGFATVQSGTCVINGSGVGYVATGVGLTNTQGSGGQKLTVDTAVVPTILRQSTVLSVGALAPGACYNGQITAPGAALWDTIAAGWPPLLPEGLVGTMWVSQTGMVSVRLCNSSTSETVAIADNFAATIVRSF